MDQSTLYWEVVWATRATVWDRREKVVTENGNRLRRRKNGYDGRSVEKTPNGITVITANGSFEEGKFVGVVVGNFVGLLEAWRFRTVPRSHRVSERHNGGGAFEVGVTLGNRCVAVGEIIAYASNADRQPLFEKFRGVPSS